MKTDHASVELNNFSPALGPSFSELYEHPCRCHTEVISLLFYHFTMKLQILCMFASCLDISVQNDSHFCSASCSLHVGR